MKNRLFNLLLLGLSLFLIQGCAESKKGSACPFTCSAESKKSSVQAKLIALNESGITGTIYFKESSEGGVKIWGKVKGLPKNSTHGFHIHETGDCSAPDGKSAGGHFNPETTSHGSLEAQNSHIGDLGNLHSNENGEVEVKIWKKKATIRKGEWSLLNRGLIIHAQADDLKSQPTGAAGARIACGVLSNSN